MNDLQGDLFGMAPPGTAIISPCGLYRYVLTRGDRPGARLVNWVMLNPSVADAERPDPTMVRCLNFARDWGYDGIILTNLFALRSTDPKGLIGHGDPVGPENDRHLVEQATRAALVVCAWGNHGVLGMRSAVVRRMLAGAGVVLHQLRPTGLGEPCHPLRQPANLRPAAMPSRP